MNAALKLQNRAYFFSIMNTIGSWLTTLAIALIASVVLFASEFSR
jgi:hypothetical protein